MDEFLDLSPEDCALLLRDLHDELEEVGRKPRWTVAHAMRACYKDGKLNTAQLAGFVKANEC